MGDSWLASPSQLAVCLLTGNLQIFITAISPILALALQIFSLISLVLIIIVNWRKIKASNEKLVTDD
jgi:hypothetical protein